MEWQPIETAPDASRNVHVLVWNSYLKRVELVYSDGGWWRRRDGDGIKTHWMPLPNPPVK